MKTKRDEIKDAEEALRLVQLKGDDDAIFDARLVRDAAIRNAVGAHRLAKLDRALSRSVAEGDLS